MSIQLHFDKTRQQVVRELKVFSENVLTLVTHHNPHHDELVAFVLFIEYCGQMFPTIQHLCFDFCDNGKPYRAKDFDTNLRDGYLCIGIGGGPLDEHGRPDHDRQEGQCSASLVVEYLNVHKLIELQKIIEWTCNADLNRVTDPFILANKVKRLYRQEKGFREIFEIVNEEVQSILVEQRKFASAKIDYDNAVGERIEVDKKKGYRIVSGISDNPYFAQYSRSSYGCQAAIIIQMNSKGNVQISSNSFFQGLHFTNIVGLIRLTELKLSGNNNPISWEKLSTAESVEGVENWYYHKEMGSIMNGSESFPNVTPTKLSVELLRSIVKTALTPELFARAMNIIDKRQAA